MKLDIRNFFTPEAIAATLQRLPAPSSPVIDLLFPLAKRINHPFPTVGAEDLGLPATNIPVVRRGSQSYSLKPSDGSIRLIEPQPVAPSTFLDAATINNMRQLNGQGQQQLIDNRIAYLRDACRATAEALCAQVLTGKINYQMVSDGAPLTYQVDYGTPAVVAVAKKWDDPATKLADIIKSLAEITEALKKKGYGMTMRFLCGTEVYAALVDKVGALANSAVAQVTTDGIQIGTIKITYLSASYVDKTGTVVSGIPAKSVVAIDESGGNRLIYASLDDLDANLVAMPFFAKPIDSKDPSGWKIVGESKPLPVVNTKAMATAQVLA